jgi:hypothetical protein
LTEADIPARDINAPTVIEIVSVVFTFGFILDEFAASQEHGWTGMCCRNRIWLEGTKSRS